MYDAARDADKERLAVAAEEAIQAAVAAREASEELGRRNRWDAEQAAKRDAETNRLIVEATSPDTPRDVAVVQARKVALALARSDGPWTRAAAVAALAGSETVALDFARTGIAAAAAQDDRETLRTYADPATATGSEAMMKAAAAALAGSDADVARFLRTRDYPERQVDDRIAVNQIIAAAQKAGNGTVVDRAQDALDDPTGQALAPFLATGQYEAAAVDGRIKVNQIIANRDTGTELKDAAQAALDGPPGLLAQFLAVGRYKAAQRDQDAAVHDAEVSSLLARQPGLRRSRHSSHNRPRRPPPRHAVMRRRRPDTPTRPARRPTRPPTMRSRHSARRPRPRSPLNRLPPRPGLRRRRLLPRLNRPATRSVQRCELAERPAGPRTPPARRVVTPGARTTRRSPRARTLMKRSAPPKRHMTPLSPRPRWPVKRRRRTNVFSVVST